jgi:hypothetical protein
MSQSTCCEYRVCIAPSPPTSPLPAKTKLFQPTAPSFPSYIFNVFAFAFPLIYSLAPLFPLPFHLFLLPLPPHPSLSYLVVSSCHVIMSLSCCHVIMSYHYLQTKYDYHWIILIYKQLNKTT